MLGNIDRFLPIINKYFLNKGFNNNECSAQKKVHDLKAPGRL